MFITRIFFENVQNRFPWSLEQVTATVFIHRELWFVCGLNYLLLWWGCIVILWDFLFTIIAQFMMSENCRMRVGLQIVLVCLYSAPSHYHHCANLTEDIELIKCLSDIFCRVLSKIKHILTQLSIIHIQYMGLCIFSLPIPFWDWENTPPSKSLASLAEQAACQNIDTHLGILIVHGNHKLGLFCHHKLIHIHELCIWCESQGKQVAVYFTVALFKTTENYCKFNENRHFTQLVMDFY